ncbi:MAG: flavin reductase family protein [Rubrivivax sp.]
MTQGLPPAAGPAAAVVDPDARELRHALGRFATGVTIVTTLDAQGQRVGLTVNSFASLSLEPPLVMWALRALSPSLPAFQGDAGFAVNVLAQDQIELSRRFASHHVVDRFAAGRWHAGAGSGLPLLEGAAAVLECERVSSQTAGDHVLFIGRVLGFSQSDRPPLVFRQGRYHRLGEHLP